MSRNTSRAAQSGRPPTGGGNDAIDHRSGTDAHIQGPEHALALNPGSREGDATADGPAPGENVAPTQKQEQAAKDKTPDKKGREQEDAAAPDNPYGDDPRYEANFGHSGYGGNGVGAGKG